MNVTEEADDILTALVGRNTTAVLGHQNDWDKSKYFGPEPSEIYLLHSVIKHMRLNYNDTEGHSLYGDLRTFELHFCETSSLVIVGLGVDTTHTNSFYARIQF